MGDTLKITNRALVKLDEALYCLDASRTGKDEVVPFVFSPKVSWALAKNAVLVERAKLAFDKAVRAQAKTLKIAPGESIKAGEEVSPEKRERFAAFTDAIEELRDQEVEISGLIYIKLEDLIEQPAAGDAKAKQNTIPQSVRNKLVPIIVDPKE